MHDSDESRLAGQSPDNETAAEAAAALRKQYGVHARDVAEKQLDLAEADQRPLWREILDRLSR